MRPARKIISLDLGCGKAKHEGCIGVDHSWNSNADIIADVEQGIPLKTDSVDEVWAWHFLEHVKDLDFVLTEINRVCKLGARVHVRVPNAWNIAGFANPHHRHFFTRVNFDGYCDGREDIPRLFRMVRLPNRLSMTPFIREFIHYLDFELEVVK